jgi:light-regulated signal transduction histidine kinase (bacteriophytochrome)
MNIIIDSASSKNAEALDYLLTESNRTAELTQSQIRIMEKQEGEVLLHRLNIKKRQDDIATVFILIFSVVSLILLVISFSWLKKENLLRNRYALSSNILEQKVTERTAELWEANQKLNEQNEILARKNAELKSFTYIASHDLKEPLRKIATFSERILTTEEAGLTDKGRFYFQRIRAAIERMQNLIEAVFAYTETETGIEFKPTDLNEVTRHAVDTLDEAVMQSKAMIVYDALPTVYAIPHQVEQLFTNLISNSIKYARQGVRPQIVISAEKETTDEMDGWTLHFKDNGIGFDEKYKDKIFQIFQRLHGNAEYSGTGVGLAICKKIVDNHKGKITVKSKEGEGTEFIIWLPMGELSEQGTE